MDDHLLGALSCQKGEEPQEAVVGHFTRLLANTYMLLFQTQRVHWCAVGPAFYGIHQMTQMQYETLFETIDTVAERIRALGQFPPISLAALVAQSDLPEGSAEGSCQSPLEGLYRAHAHQAQMCRDHIGCCESSGDVVSADLLTTLCAFHEKALWMIRATLQS